MECTCADKRPRPSLEHEILCPVKLRFYGGDPRWDRSKVYVRLTINAPSNQMQHYVYVYMPGWSWMPLHFMTDAVANELRKRNIEVVE